jgi:SAM-dependent methyltransferase
MIAAPSEEELRRVLATKEGRWARRRQRFCYFSPDDWYEALVCRLVAPETRWLDVGGGSSPFPHNAVLAAGLSQRCQLLVGVDPSPNVRTNAFVHERAQSPIEEFESPHRFDLVTLRMVAEHIADPPRVVGKLRDLLAPGGLVVVFTVSSGSPVSMVAAVTPQRLHHPLKRRLWGGEEKDTFPVYYRMNTRSTLQRIFEAAGFAERLFLRLDDLAVFSKINALNWFELMTWRALRTLRLPYPECCLLGVYERTTRELN